MEKGFILKLTQVIVLRKIYNVKVMKDGNRKLIMIEDTLERSRKIKLNI
jgi:hypothetical protein